MTNRTGRALTDSVHEITRFEPPHLVEERIRTLGTLMVATCEVRRIGDDRSVLIVRGRIEWGGSFLEFVSRLLSPLTGPPSRRKVLRRIKAVIEKDIARGGAESHLGQEG